MFRKARLDLMHHRGTEGTEDHYVCAGAASAPTKTKNLCASVVNKKINIQQETK